MAELAVFPLQPPKRLSQMLPGGISALMVQVNERNLDHGCLDLSVSGRCCCAVKARRSNGPVQ
jgi:hypothetical protein